MIFTTNKPIEAWGQVLHDPDLAEAILDRALERGRVIQLRGASFRTRHLPRESAQLPKGDRTPLEGALQGRPGPGERGKQPPSDRAIISGKVGQEYLEPARIRRVRDKREQQQVQGSLNHLYEVEVAARLGFTFSKIKFAEPDLVIEDPEFRVGWSIACKRPQSANSLLQVTRRATAQIARDGRPGVVMISLDRLVDPFVYDLSGSSLEPICHQRQDKSLDLETKRTMLEAIDRHPATPDGASASVPRKGVLGILASASFILLGRDGPTGPDFLNTRTEPMMVNREEPKWAKAATWVLLSLFKRGDEALKAPY